MNMELAVRQHNRIVNGDPSRQSLASYMALLVSTKGLCTGTVIGPTTIITAAHCQPTASIAYVGGTTGSRGTFISISEFIPDRNFYFASDSDDEEPLNNFQYDFALIKLSRKVPSLIKFMKISANFSLPTESTYVRVAGYGLLEERQDEEPATNQIRRLYQIDLPVFQSDTCEKLYNSLRTSNGERVVDVNTILQTCAGYSKGECSPCNGDSGGPLFQYIGNDPVLIAVVSFGIGCARKTYPGVFVRTAQYKQVIQRFSDDRLLKGESQFVTRVDEVPAPPQGLSSSSISNIVIIILCVAAVVVLIACILLILVCIRRRKKKNNLSTSAQPQTTTLPSQNINQNNTEVIHPAIIPQVPSPQQPNEYQPTPSTIIQPHGGSFQPNQSPTSAVITKTSQPIHNLLIPSPSFPPSSLPLQPSAPAPQVSMAMPLPEQIASPTAQPLAQTHIPDPAYRGNESSS